MKKLALVAFAALSFSPAFARPFSRWQTVGRIPNLYCSPGIYQGQQCTSDVPAGYECQLNGQVWGCDYFNGANRVHYKYNIPNYCGGNVYNGAQCYNYGARCSNGSDVLVCR